MNMKMKVFNFLCLVFCLAHPLGAQQGIVSSGGDIFSQDGSIAYSVGQIVYVTINGETGNLHPGLQQPFQFSIVGLSDLHQNYSFKIYPNPANQFLFLQISTDADKISWQDLMAKIYDAKGNLLINQRLNNDINSILISGLPEALYFVQIWQSNTPLQSFSFSKTN